MTNTIYFYHTIRDDESVSTSPGDTSQRDIDIVEEDGHVSFSSSVIRETCLLDHFCVSPTSGVEPKYISPNQRPLYYATPQCVSSNINKFNFKELETATRKFHPDGVVGIGYFGTVFKGWIDENTLLATKPGRGTVVAVKRLNLQGSEGYREWLTEVQYLGRLRHSNLVKLLGYCIDAEERLLVFEFMPRGSLDNHFYRRSSNGLLSWSLRIKIALGTAKALAFLHNAERNVIHCDFTSSNVLLDSNYNAKVSDFGLAKDGCIDDMEYVSIRIPGTYAYAAREYVNAGHPTVDVFSFGVVLLELLSGRRAVDKNGPLGEHSLVQWAKPLLSNKRKILHILDSRLKGQYSLGSAQKAANLALLCIAMAPNMDEVVTTLEQLQES